MLFDLLRPRARKLAVDRQQQILFTQMRIVVTHHLNLLDLDPRVPAAPATCSTNYTQPQATFPKSPRSRGIAVLLPGGSDNFDHAPAKPEPPSSKSSASAPKPAVAQDWVVDRPAQPLLSHRTLLGPAASARSSASSAPDCAPPEKSTLANCLSAAPSVNAETTPKTHPAQSLPHAPPSAQSTTHTAAICSGIRQTAQSPHFRFPRRQYPAPPRQSVPRPKETQSATQAGS